MKAHLRAAVRALPAGVALPGLSVAGRLDCFRPGPRAEAEAHMRLLLRDTPLQGRAPALARAHLRRRRVLEELVWRPGLSLRAPIEAEHTLRAARAAGAGCVIAHTHLCLMAPQIYALAAQGYGDVLVLGVEDPPQARDRHYDRVFRGLGVEQIDARGAYRPVLRRLREGRLCHIALDVPGREACEFVGKPAGLAGGVGALAFASGAPVVMVFARLRRSRLELRVQEPVHPGDFASRTALTAHLAAIASREILTAPELYHAHDWLSALWAPREG